MILTRHLALAAFLLTLLSVPAGVQAADIPETVTLFKNVKIFDGTTDELKEGLDVLVVKNKIHKIAKDIPTGASFEIDTAGDAVRELPDVVGRGEYNFRIIDEAELDRAPKDDTVGGGEDLLVP